VHGNARGRAGGTERDAAVQDSAVLEALFRKRFYNSLLFICMLPSF